MGLDTLIHAAIATANTLTVDLQVEVQHEAFTGRTRAGVSSYAAPVTRPALVSLSTRRLMTTNGGVMEAMGPITFLADVVVGMDDRITLPNGVLGVIAAITRPVDPAGAGYVTKVWIGYAPRGV